MGCPDLSKSGSACPPVASTVETPEPTGEVLPADGRGQLEADVCLAAARKRDAYTRTDDVLVRQEGSRVFTPAYQCAVCAADPSKPAAYYPSRDAMRQHLASHKLAEVRSFLLPRSEDIRLQPACLAALEEALGVKKSDFDEAFTNGGDFQSDVWAGRKLWINQPWRLNAAVAAKLRTDPPDLFIMVVNDTKSGDIARLMDFCAIPRRQVPLVGDGYFEEHSSTGSVRKLPCPPWVPVCYFGTRADLEKGAEAWKQFDNATGRHPSPATIPDSGNDTPATSEDEEESTSTPIPSETARVTGDAASDEKRAVDDDTAGQLEARRLPVIREENPHSEWAPTENQVPPCTPPNAVRGPSVSPSSRTAGASSTSGSGRAGRAAERGQQPDATSHRKYPTHDDGKGPMSAYEELLRAAREERESSLFLRSPDDAFCDDSDPWQLFGYPRPPSIEAAVERIQTWIDRRAKRGANLTPEQSMDLDIVLARNAELFREQLGSLSSHKYVIHTTDERPIRARPLRCSTKEREYIRRQVQKMLEADVIEASESSWSSSVVLVEKKDGTIRFAIDYRALNAKTPLDLGPIGNTQDVLDSLAGSRWFSSLDARAGFHQQEIDEGSRYKTAFLTHEGLYQWKRLPMGLNNAPASFARMMQSILGSVGWEKCLIYLDDVLVHTKGSFEQHLKDLDDVCSRLRRAGLTMKLSKCLFATDSLVHLGHRISADGIAPDPAKLKAVAALTPPEDKTAIRGFLGMVGYYRRHVENFAHLAAPLEKLLEGTLRGPVTLTPEALTSWQRLRDALLNAPILAFPDFSKDAAKFVVKTDACDTQIAAALTQNDKAVAYLSARLRGAELKWHTTEKECYAIVWALKKWRTYLVDKPFIVETDHSALLALKTKMQATPRLVRWALELQNFSFDLRHVKGAQNSIADALSRLDFDETVNPKFDVDASCHLGRHPDMSDTTEEQLRRRDCLDSVPTSKTLDECLPVCLFTSRDMDGQILAKAADLSKEESEQCNVLSCRALPATPRSFGLHSVVSSGNTSKRFPKKTPPTELEAYDVGNDEVLDAYFEWQREGAALGETWCEEDDHSLPAFWAAKGWRLPDPPVKGPAPRSEDEATFCNGRLPAAWICQGSGMIVDRVTQDLRAYRRPSSSGWNERWWFADGRPGPTHPAFLDQCAFTASTDESATWREDRTLLAGHDRPFDDQWDKGRLAPPAPPVVPLPSIDLVRKAQQDDFEAHPEISPLYHTGRPPRRHDADHELPADGTDFVRGPARKFGVGPDDAPILVRRSARRQRAWIQLCIPQRFRERYLQAAHLQAGHLGTTRTYYLLRQDSWWPGMLSDVRRYVRECDACVCNKHLGPLPAGPSESPIDHFRVPNGLVGVDIVGHFPKTPSGFIKLLVMVDHFAKYRVAVPLYTEEAQEVVTAIVVHWIDRFGAPLRFRSDNGNAFISQLFRSTMFRHQIGVDYTLAANPTANGLVENANASYLAMLRVRLQRNVHDWDAIVRLVTLAYNTTPHEVTGVIPHDVLHRTPFRGLIDRAARDELLLAPSELHSDWLRRQRQIEEDCFTKVRDTLQLAFDLAQARLARRAVRWTPAPGDLVYVFDAAATDEAWRAYLKSQADPFKSRKLATNWHGPYRVDGMDNPSTVRVLVPYKTKTADRESAITERFPLHHVKLYTNLGCVMVEQTGGQPRQWIPEEVIEMAAPTGARPDWRYRVRYVDGCTMDRILQWKDPHEIPTELVQRALDARWFQQLQRSRGPPPPVAPAARATAATAPTAPRAPRSSSFSPPQTVPSPSAEPRRRGRPPRNASLGRP